MTTKLISLVTGLATLAVYLQSQLSSNDPLFLLVSNSLVINVLMVALAAAGIAVAFREKFDSWQSYLASSLLGAGLIIIGVAGLGITSLTYAWDALLPLNYVMMLQVGIVLSICNLSYRHQPVPRALRPTVWLPKALKYRPVFPAPKIPHSPSMARRSTASGAS
jgi:hypothetical protein